MNLTSHMFLQKHQSNKHSHHCIQFRKMEDDILAFLTSPISVQEFLSEYWSKKPAVFAGSPQRKEIFRKLFTTSRFEKLVNDGSGSLKFGSDILTGRYRNGKRERPTPMVCDVTAVKGLFDSGCTLQVVQPQRFLEDLRDTCVRLESSMNCLVGCNAYLTPAKTQGLAPHHDDVELFVCQTQGSKKWKLYDPIKGFVLPNGPSGDLSQKEVGPMILEVELKEGDVLYMPKGIVHQAKAQEVDSVHLTISTYQRWSWSDLLSTMISDTIMADSEPLCLPEALREELPVDLIPNVGRYVGSLESAKVASNTLARKLRILADRVESKPEILQSTVDLMAYQFLTSRMPPPDSFIPEQENYPELTDRIKVVDQRMFRIMSVVDGEGKIDQSVIQVVSCLKNDIQSHMFESNPAETEENKEEMVIFLIQQKEALLQIFNPDNKDGIKVRDLCLPTDGEKVKLASTLWEEGIVFAV